ncbi:DUF3618 domain-containing protein [Actinomadura sp. NTSP31]|uniref:DUF3618 domain-containing protein n=1 Tax=Actinomadura sp. NTSP31 TaxID=1735447 RepID=UPI0035C180ED
MTTDQSSTTNTGPEATKSKKTGPRKSGTQETSPRTSGSPGSGPGADAPEELQEQVEHHRRKLGETVEALAAKTDVRTRAKQQAKEKAEQVRQLTTATAQDTVRATRDKAGQAGRQVQAKASEFTARARQTATDPENQPAVRRSAAFTAALGAAGGLAVWAWTRRRRRAARPLTRWEKLATVAQRTGTRMRQQAAESNTVSAASAAVASAVGNARKAAASPEFKPRAQGAATATAVLSVWGWRRRRRAVRRTARGQVTVI